MPGLPAASHVRLPRWIAGLPWMLLTVLLAAGSWLISRLRQQLAYHEEVIAMLRRQESPAAFPEESQNAIRRYALKTTVEMAKIRGWVTTSDLLPEFLPDAVKLLGQAPELREIAIAGLTGSCSSFLNHTSEQSPAFSTDGRWIITRFPDGTLVFSDVNFLDPDTFVLKAGARDFRTGAGFLYYQTAGGWQRAALHSPPDGQAELGQAEAYAGIPPDPPPPPAIPLIRPRIGGDPARLIFLTGQDPGIPVHQPENFRSPPSSVVLSPDGRFAAVWHQNGAIRIWRLALLRERLARLGLDWNMPAFPAALNDETLEGALKGAEFVPAAWRTAAPPESDAPPLRAPRGNVKLPTASPDATKGSAPSASLPDDQFHLPPAFPVPGSGSKPPRRRVVLPHSEAGAK